MIRTNAHRFRTIRSLLLVGLFTIELVASTAIPAFAQSGTWSKTGSMMAARGKIHARVGVKTLLALLWQF